MVLFEAVFCGDKQYPGNISQLIAAFYDMKRYGMRDLSETRFVVKTANNEEALKEVCDFLENEAYPLLGYELEVGFGSISLGRIIL